MRSVGLHIRINETLSKVASYAKKMGLSSFQCFGTLHTSGTKFEPTHDDIRQFALLQKQFNSVFMHGSYYTNPASCARTYHPVLERELKLAKKLGISYIIMHPGAATGSIDIDEGIDALARVINNVHARQNDVTLVMENTAHFNKAVGSNFEHFKLLLERIDDKQRIKFCFDTAHAFAYGYDMSDSMFHERMIDILDDTIGIERIILIHLNDTQEKLGSYIDRHCVPGQGCIGSEALRAFVTHEKLAHIPLMLELPTLADQEYKQILDITRTWE